MHTLALHAQFTDKIKNKPDKWIYKSINSE